MGKAERARRNPGATTAARPDRGLQLWACALAVAAFFVLLRVGVAAPWGYDDYYHLGIAREMGKEFPLRAFPWAQFSILSERYADKEPLFHLLLMPLNGASVEVAAAVGSFLGQASLIAALAAFLWTLRGPSPGWWMLGLAALGPLFSYRLEQLRPHIWLLAGSVLVLTLLVARVRWWILAVVAAMVGLLHIAGWVSVFVAGVWWLSHRYGKGERVPIAIPLAVAAGWLGGQLLHPNLPRNFELAWMVNAVVPLGAAGGVSQSLAQAIGVELQRPTVGYLFEQWPIFVPAAVATGALLSRRSARTAAAVALGLVTWAFLLAGCLWMRRLLEMAGVFGLLWISVVAAQASARGEMPPWLGRRRLATAAWLLAATLWTVTQVRDLGRGDRRPLGRGQPLGMGRFLAAQGNEGDRVFTAQWADSAPLFYLAPHLRTLVALDPTFFALADPRRFDRYWAIAHGKSRDPAAEIRQEFGARFVTVWRAPGFMPLARQLRSAPGARMIFADDYYEVWELPRG